MERPQNVTGGKRGRAPFAGTARRVLRTRGACPLFPRRGSAYIAVLGAATIVTVIGLSALWVARVRGRGAKVDQDAAQARFYAQSAVDIVRFRIANDPNWRTTYTHDTWQADKALGEHTFSFKLADEADGDLANDPSQPVRLYTRANVGDATRLYSVLLQPPESPNVLTNTGFEDGTAGWVSWNCTLVPSGEPHTGAACMLLEGRADLFANAWQDVTGIIKNGQAYSVEVWAKTRSGTENLTISFRTIASTSGTRIFVSDSTLVGTTWTKVTGTLTPTWSGTLTQARWRVYSYPDGGSADFYIDDAVMIDQSSGQTLTVVPGTWRQETLP